MIDIILLIGRLLFVVLLYLFLFAIMKTGIGLVRGSRKKEHVWTVAIEKGPKNFVVCKSQFAALSLLAEAQDRTLLSAQNTFLRAMLVSF